MKNTIEPAFVEMLTLVESSNIFKGYDFKEYTKIQGEQHLKNFRELFSDAKLTVDDKKRMYKNYLILFYSGFLVKENLKISLQSLEKFRTTDLRIKD